jgi:hypothetical protein
VEEEIGVTEPGDDYSQGGWWRRGSHNRPNVRLVVLVFSALTINMVYKITHFPSRVGLVNKNTDDLSWFKPLLVR